MSRAVTFTLGAGCVAAAVVVAAAAACSDYGAADDPPAPDGAADAPAASDATDAADESVPVDADASDAGPPCSDVRSVREAWSNSASLGGWLVDATNGTVAVSGLLPDGAAPPSSPSALFAFGTIPDGGSSIVASVERDFVYSAVTGRLSFALYAPRSTNYSEVGCVVRFAALAPDKSATIQIYTTNTSLQARRAAAVDGPVLPLGPRPSAAFTTIEMIFDADTDAAIAHATVRRLAPGNAILATADIGEMPIPSGATTLKVVCGIGYADVGSNPDSRDVQVAVDDVELDLCKH